MNNKDISEKKLERITGVKDLSIAIKKLEREKEVMEDELKADIHYYFESLNPMKILNRTLQNVKKSSSSKFALLEESLQFGAGYLSKEGFMSKLKAALIKAFRVPANIIHHKPVGIVTNKSNDESEMDFKKKNLEMYPQNEKQIEEVKAKPEKLPDPTYWPFFLALGLLFGGWGLLTTWYISVAGLIVFIVSLIGWINILRHERRK